ncbi:MAG: restriction endonuclease subunit S [Rhodocyclaceae bacterium]|nr:restriction endonuclease subunit S [Rhodocyclaceae bacterium]
MSRWPLKTVGDICDVNPRLPRGHNIADDQIVSFVPMAAVDEVSGTIQALHTRPFAEVKKGYTHFMNGDVLFAKITPCMENGKAAIASELVGGLGFGSTEFHVLRAKNGVLPEWLFYFVRQPAFRNEAKRNFTGTAGQQRVPTTFLSSAVIPVPPLPEQRRIVDLLSRAEGIVRLRHEAEKKTAELIPALFLDMFGDPATNPKGWEVALLPNVLARPFKNGLYLPKERYAPEGTNLGVEMVHMSDAFYGEVKRGGLRRVFAEGKQVDDYNLTKTDLLVARRSLNFDGAAKLCGIPEHDQPLLFESSFIRLTPNLDRVRTEYLLHYLNNEHTRKAFVLSRISGITISGINQAALNSIPVMVPPCQIQDQFVGKVDQARAIETQQSAAAAKAHSAFDALLARAFSFDEVLQ